MNEKVFKMSLNDTKEKENCMYDYIDGNGKCGVQNKKIFNYIKLSYELQFFYI